MIDLNKNIIKDKKGFFSLLDGILAIFILFIALMVFSSVLNFYAPSPYDDFIDSKVANDVMELAMVKIDENSYSTLEHVASILKNNNNTLDYETKQNIANVAGKFLNKTIPDKNYLLVENNCLNGETIVSRGDIRDALNVSTSTRNLGEYSFTLFVF